MSKFRWTDIPIMFFGSIFLFAASVFILMGVDLFPGHDGSRWGLLAVLTLLSVFCCVFGRD